jgi:hypothetical protein
MMELQLLFNSLPRDSFDTDAKIQPILQLVRKWVNDAFAQVDNYHGSKHVQKVEENVIFICDHLDIQVSNVEKLLLCTAALLHDVGFAAYSPSWSQDRREHVNASLDFTMDNLTKVPIFSLNPAFLPIVCYLIAHHDDRNFKYPSAVREGKVEAVVLGRYTSYLDEFELSLSLEQKQRLQFLLDVLAVADALTATGEEGAKRTFGYSRERGLLTFAPGNRLNAWCWEESAVGNVRLAAKGSLTSAFSSESKRIAQEGYEAMEHFIKTMCFKNNEIYFPETFTNLGDSDVSLDDPQYKVQLLSYLDWKPLKAKLRNVPLLGDKSLFPYANAQIKAHKYTIRDLRPTSLYVLRSQLERHRKLQVNLQLDYKLSLFDLTGIIEYKQNGDSFLLSPPIVETYYETMEHAMVTAIVDGLHRIWLARELGLEEIWLIEISTISDKFPLVPLPLNWDEVQLSDTVPSTSDKRRFRFPTIESFPNISDITKVPITQENFRYFFYRDLSSLGSSGIRSPE